MTTEAVHYKIPGDTSARFLCDQWDDDEDTPRTDEAGAATCPGCRKAADEVPTRCRRAVSAQTPVTGTCGNARTG
jgi:hypothetical protein